LAEVSKPVAAEHANLVALEHVNKWLGEDQVLCDVSLNLARGERLVICGPSGAGKSTLLRCINGLERHQSGRIVVNGTALIHHTKALQRVRLDVGMVFQSFNLFQHLTVLENCSLAPVWVRGITAQQAEALALEYLRRVHMEDYRHSYPSQLSGGEQQRVAIARALCMQPKVMMFDEPTSALDPEMTKEVLDIIVELSTTGMTMLCVTHEMGFARQIADRMIFLDGGRITEQGSPAEFFQSPRTERLKTFLNQVLHAQHLQG
jgi:general L-amino acid transport system ATP-binding protein